MQITARLKSAGHTLPETIHWFSELAQQQAY